MEEENEMLDIIIIAESIKQVENKTESIIMPLPKNRVNPYPEYHVQLWSSSLSLWIQ